MITAKYAKQTRRLADDTKRMADVMVQEYERKVRPLMHVEIVRGPYDVDKFELVFKILNLGFSSITTNGLKLRWWFSDQPNDTDKDSIDFSLSTVLQPQGEPVEKKVSLSTAVILRKRDKFKDQDNWQTVLKNIIWFQPVITHSGKEAGTWVTTEGQPIKYK